MNRLGACLDLRSGDRHERLTQALQQNDGHERLLVEYEEASGQPIPETTVRIHELLLQLGWLQETEADWAVDKRDGHAPEHYVQLVAGLLRRIGE